MRTTRTADTNADGAVPLLRAGSRCDLPMLLRIERECFVGDYARHRFCASDFLAYLRNPSSIFRVAVLGEEPIGYAAGQGRRARGEMRARLDGIAVLPKWRRQGVGKRLLSWFLQEAKRQNVRRVTLEVLVSNEAGRGWFSRAGFHETRRLRNYYGAGLDGIEMQRKG